MTEITEIRPASIHDEFGNLYVHAKKVSNPKSVLYISGQVGVDSAGNIGKSCKEQLDLAWNNVDSILAEAGMSKRNIIDVFVFFNGAEQHNVEENKGVYAESVLDYFGDDVPAMSGLVGAGLRLDEFAFEFKLRAAI